MPTYDYRCGECGHEFEEFQSMSSESLKKCPKCGKDALKRAMGSGAGMIFKGGGFYQTDYKKGENKAKASEAKKDKVKETKKAEGTTESKPAKSETKKDTK